MYDRWVAGDHEGARDLHYALHPLVSLLFVETNPAPAKWVLRQCGRIASAHVREPLAPASEAGVRRIHASCSAGAAGLIDPGTGVPLPRGAHA
jgi:4-hydroxy-tetrahydrodipicolinate synthase